MRRAEGVAEAEMRHKQSRDVRRVEAQRCRSAESQRRRDAKAQRLKAAEFRVEVKKGQGRHSRNAGEKRSYIGRRMVTVATRHAHI